MLHTTWEYVHNERKVRHIPYVGSGSGAQALHDSKMFTKSVYYVIETGVIRHQSMITMKAMRLTSVVKLA